mmetsp:Transcript_18565/g.50744  ORF Transcript_18565/g.50744 Transcript_18565/m.50744 type:complete len:178 (+) Transcript_18565:143-676(+)
MGPLLPRQFLSDEENVYWMGPTTTNDPVGGVQIRWRIPSHQDSQGVPNGLVNPFADRVGLRILCSGCPTVNAVAMQHKLKRMIHKLTSLVMYAIVRPGIPSQPSIFKLPRHMGCRLVVDTNDLHQVGDHIDHRDCLEANFRLSYCEFPRSNQERRHPAKVAIGPLDSLSHHALVLPI